jgi:hypothetical protein
MLLDIWFPEIVIVVGGIGAFLCFAMFFSHVDEASQHHEEDEHHH